MKIVIGHLYPELLNLYGDRGNILTLQKRCEWRGFECEVRKYQLGDFIDFEDIDIALLGGGSDREQMLVCQKLMEIKEGLKTYIENNKILLAICGGYQLLGEYYHSAGGRIPGLDLIKLRTESGNERLIGNVVVNMELGEKNIKLVGFENHAGRTTIDDNRPLGKVIHGYGNNGSDGYEGIRYKNVFGTYLHGPLLPKNPEFADYIIEQALKNKGFDGVLEPLNDELELLANETVVKRFCSE